MAENKQPTKEEKQKAERATALNTISQKTKFWDYALPKLITSEQFGQISKSAKARYDQSLEKTPDQNVYERIFLPQLKNEGGAVTSPYIQAMSLNILYDSFSRIMVKDVFDYVGSKKPLERKYDKKYIFELPEKERQNIIAMCMSYVTHKKVIELENSETKNIVSGLEKILGEPDKKAA